MIIIKNLNKEFLIFIFLIIFLQPLKIFASENKINIKDTSKITSKALEKTIELILENYYYNITAEELYEAAMKGIFDYLDKHSNYYSVEDYKILEMLAGDYFYDIGFIIKYIDNDYFIESITKNSNGEKLGLQIDDKIISINDKIIKNIEPNDLNKILLNLDEKFSLLINRDNKNYHFFLTKEKIENISVKGFNISEVIPNVSDERFKYIKISHINSKSPELLKNLILDYKLKNVEGIILDLRNNPGGEINAVINICSLLLNDEAIGYSINKKNHLEFHLLNSTGAAFNNIVVVVDKNTASSAEILTSALQECNKKIVGEKTFGKGVGQIIVDGALKDSVFKLTTFEYFTKKGKQIEGVGIIPDYLISTPDFIENLNNIDYINLKNILEQLEYPVGKKENNLDHITINSLTQFQKDNLIPEGIFDLKTLHTLNNKLKISLEKNDKALLKAYNILKAE